MTDEQLDELGRLRKECDEARERFHALETVGNAPRDAATCAASADYFAAQDRYREAADAAVPALVAEVRLLTRAAKERRLAGEAAPGEAATGDDLVDRLRGIYAHPEGERRFHSSSINREAADRILELSRDVELTAALAEAEALRDRYSDFALHHANGWRASFWHVDERGHEIPGVTAIGATAAEAVRRAVARVKETNP